MTEGKFPPEGGDTPDEQIPEPIDEPGPDDDVQEDEE